MAEQSKDETDIHSTRAAGLRDHVGVTTREEVTKGAQSKSAEEVTVQGSEGQKPSMFKKIWNKLGLDAATLMSMFKGSLPPTIAVAMYQSKGVQDVYGTSGYLVAVISVLAFCIMPRAKFLQNLALDIFALCLAAAINLLALFCATKARINTTSSSTPTTYNATQSTVLAIWLIFETYVVNTIRASRPQLQFPVIIYSVFATVTLTYGVSFPDMPYAIGFVTNLMETFLTGMGIATAVHFVVFPLTSRKVVMMEWTGYYSLLTTCLRAHLAYMAAVADIDLAKLSEQHEKEHEGPTKFPKPQGPFETSASVPYLNLRQNLIQLHVKIDGDITPAKQEFAIGKLEHHDFSEIWKLTKNVFLPVLALGSMLPMLEHLAEENEWSSTDGTEEEVQKRQAEMKNLRSLLRQLQAPFATQITNIEAALRHVMLTLELIKPPKKQRDEESRIDSLAEPGTSRFAETFRKQVDEFYASKQKTLKDWCHEHGAELPEDLDGNAGFRAHDVLAKGDKMRGLHQKELFFMLYFEYLLWRVSTSILDLILYVDRRKQDGIFKSSRLIFPGSRSLYQWAKAAFGHGDLSYENSYIAEFDTLGARPPYLAEDFAARAKDPEHLPPRNRVEKFGNALRAIPKFFRSEDSVHGLRVAAATISIGIICYVKGSQEFFVKERFLWAMIMVSISMMNSAGQSVMQFVLRVLGTVAATIGSYIVWYIVDGRKPGVIVFLWLWMFLALYFVVKFPQYAIGAIISLVTVLLIIAYELQVRAIGVEEAESNGQPVYPTYELAPYRLAIVAGGLLVAFIWTIFPFPVSESSIIRRDLAAAIYLLCSFYSIVQVTITNRIMDTGGDPGVMGTHSYNLEKARSRTFAQLLSILQRCKMNSSFSKFQLQIGGRFPQQTYEELITIVQRLSLWTSLSAYSSSSLQSDGKDGAKLTKRSSEFRQAISANHINCNKYTSVLSLLASSLTNAQPLPPYIQSPQPFQFAEMLENFDRDILSVRHIEQPEYSTFAVMQIVSENMSKDLAQLVSLIRGLVGEIDFWYHEESMGSSPFHTSSAGSTDCKGKES